MGYQLTGDQHKAAARRIGDILRQLGQAEYPHDPEEFLVALQAVGEGRFEAVGHPFPSMIHAPKLIPEGWRVIEDVEPTAHSFSDFEFVTFLEEEEQARTIKGAEMRQCAIKRRGNMGLLDGKLILAHQSEIPTWSDPIVLPGTVLRTLNDDLAVLLLRRRTGFWISDYGLLHESWFSGDYLARLKAH